MSRKRRLWRWANIAAFITLSLLSHTAAAAGRAFYVSPTGSDEAAGAQAAPFRTLHRAQAAARAGTANMDGDIVVNVAPGVYRLAQTLELTEADSGRNGHRVVYRSAGGLGKARLLGSMPLVGWQPHRDGIWKIEIPEGMLFHTLYENGRRAWKARFPNYEHHLDMPTARGRYLVSVDGSPKSKKGEKNGWLIYRPEDAPPVTSVTKMKLLLFSEGKCDWMRTVRKVTSIEPEARRVTFAGRFWRGVGARARFFFEDELGFLDAPGEFYLDEAAHTLYYKPMGKGHPDTLGIAAPVLRRLIQIKGKSRDACVENVTLEGLTLEETDGFPKGWWGAQYGRSDGALVWMSNTAHVEIRNCHLRNSGRSGVMMIGHNTGNLVAGCWIEHMAVNGVTLCNRFPATKAGPNLDRCERNRVYNCRIDHVGEVHTYAACVNVFNASYNEISHCELHDSVRYAVTVRGNTGPQYGPPVWTTQPRAKGNRMHHLRVYRCGQDGGDMGALHCADLNNPGGGCVNTFEQITVADTRAIPSMKDIGPDGIFLDWPKMSMDQAFRNVHIIRCQGRQLRSNGPDNAVSARTENVSWKPGFDENLMDYEHIGLTTEFPAEYGGRPPVRKPLAAPAQLAANALADDRVLLTWQAPPHPAGETPRFAIYRNGARVAKTASTRYVDAGLAERTTYRYRVSATSGDFRKFGPLAKEVQAHTPADRAGPRVTGACILLGRRRVRVTFDEPLDAATAETPSRYRFAPPVRVIAAKPVFPESVELTVEGLRETGSYTLAVEGVRDRSAARNASDPARRVRAGAGKVVAWYPLKRLRGDWLIDESGNGGNARLCAGAVVEPEGGPAGGPALYLDGKAAYAEAPADLNLGAGDFTLMAWIYKERGGIVLSKGNGFGSPRQWSWGWENLPRSISLRVNNRFLSSAPESVPYYRWVHIAFVKRGTRGQAYINGKPSGEAHDMPAFGPFINDRPLRIGRRDYKPTPAFFKGKIAGVLLLNYALDPQSIRDHAAGTAKTGATR